MFYNTDAIPKVKRFFHKLFLLNKFPSSSKRYTFSKFLMILYIFLMSNYIINSITSVGLNIKQILIIGILYPLTFRMFFNGSYEK